MRIYQASLTLRVLKKYINCFRNLSTSHLGCLVGGGTRGVLRQPAYDESIIADSGAWSVAKGTSTFSIDALISYLKLWGHLFHSYFSFEPILLSRGSPTTTQISNEWRGKVFLPFR